jgi:MEMO1 family protein
VHAIRPAAVAGTFYPADPAALSGNLEALLGSAQAQLPPHAASPKAIIAPHAGYIYSGAVAASVYARVAKGATHIRRVILLGPAHRVALRGLALPGVQAFETPLGRVPIDQQGIDAISALPQVVVNAAAHALEHSIEVHLPFLQSLLGPFTLLPLVVGHASAEEVSQVLDRVWGGADTLIVVSSDLSHYLAYHQAQSADRDTANAILNRRADLDSHQACGAAPVNGLLLAASRRGLTPQLHDLRNSGDTAGDRSRVVGYASFGFYADAAGAGDELGDILLPIARSAIGDMFGLAVDVRSDHRILQEQGACFITLMRHGQLRGCIGTLEPHRTLLADIKANAKAAAFTDPRFEPLTATEFKGTVIEISLLSATVAMNFASEEEALAGLRPGIDGLVFEWRGHRSTFLPQVWEQLPDPRDFLAHLKRKAGLAPDFWAPEVTLKRYTVTKWRERDLPDPDRRPLG